MPCGLHLLPAPLHVPRRTFHEYVVIHLIDTRRKLLSGPVEHRIKRLALVALEVFVRGPIVRLESVEVGTPFQVVTQLVGERLPGFLAPVEVAQPGKARERDRKSTRLNSSHGSISYAVFCLKKKTTHRH